MDILIFNFWFEMAFYGSHVFFISRKAQTSDEGHVDGLVQDCSNSIANALELLQSCPKPLTWTSERCM